VSKEVLKCSFCDKSISDLRYIIVSNNATICDACLVLCIKIILEQSKKQLEALKEKK